MNYYEDYMELLETLPIEIRERFTEMRQLDLQLQNSMEPLEERISTFFGKCNQLPAVVDPHWKVHRTFISMILISYDDIVIVLCRPNSISD